MLREIARDGGDVVSLLADPRVQAFDKIAGSQALAAVQDVISMWDLERPLDFIGNRFHGLTGMIGTLEDAVDQRVPLAEIGEVAANLGGELGLFVETMDRALKRSQETNAGDDEDGMALLTYFRAKGRQWHTVFLTTCNEGLIPHRRAPVEDERRLFYVAMTRASANLLVSYVKDAIGTSVPPSRFLTEAACFEQLLLSGLQVQSWRVS